MSSPITREAALADLPAKPRVHELSRRIGLSNKELLAVLAERGLEVRSASASVPAAVARDLIEAHFGAAEAADSDGVPGGTAADLPTEDVLAAVPDSPGPQAAPAAPDEAAPAAAPINPLFLAPEPVTVPSGSPRSGSEVSAEASGSDAGSSAVPATEDGPAENEAPTAGRRRRGRGRRQSGEQAHTAPPAEVPAPTADDAATPAPAATPVTEADEDDSVADAPEQDQPSGDDADGGRGRRRRRGRRGRGRVADDATDATEGDDDQAPTASDEPAASADESADEDADQTDGDNDSADAADAESDGDRSNGSRRRRRRRRRGGADDAAESSDNDPADTVVHVREPREARESRSSGGTGANEVQGLRGSTRLEAKRQRRRDSRESRRRPQILTEAEFLARREAVDRVMAVRQRGDLAQVALLEDGILVEHFVSQTGADSLIGSVFLGRVQNVLPSMEAAFVDIGRGRNAVLYAGEVNWDAAGLAGKARRIETALSSGDSMLVQVSKDPVGHKGARLTTQIALPGRFLVYVPNGGATGISRKLPDTERKRLKSILDRIVPEDAGVIIRTAAEGISEEELARDVERLKAQWEDISRRAEQKSSAPTRLYAEPGTLLKVVRDLFNSDINRLVIDSDDTADGAYRPVKEYVDAVAPELSDRVERYESATGADVFAAFRIDEQIAKALDRKVHLPSGGSLVIDRTEAMTVVDVNTGKYTGSGGNLEETVTRNNLEAAEEIVRQLRLRDIGGIIVVDFIDMVLESNRDLVLRRLTECLGRDRSRHQVAEVTSLGLVQMTRKKMGTGLVEAFSDPCPHCSGRGIVLHELHVPAAVTTTEPADSTPVRDRSERGERRGRNRRGNRRNEPEEIERPAAPRVPPAGLRPDPRGPKPPSFRSDDAGAVEDGVAEDDGVTTVVRPAGADADDVAEALLVGAVSAAADSPAARDDVPVADEPAADVTNEGADGYRDDDPDELARADAGDAVAAVTAALRAPVSGRVRPVEAATGPDAEASPEPPAAADPVAAPEPAAVPPVSTTPAVPTAPAALAPPATRPRRRAAGRAAGAPATATAVDIVIDAAAPTTSAAPVANGTVVHSSDPAPTGRRRAASRPAGPAAGANGSGAADTPSEPVPAGE
ncbi:Rne/Rng family ribonuclease [Nakamurella flava]|uniref:Ribonuclease E n=1 Tax=Nakamurella flava TaxID=2576308 RepID=A0A4U6QLI0_9ACTN|nr:Rne/Rng family ribonuclease [Nakamurella flava]TKV61410.1 Rne/Rng family ribonuclease [Nakamurella flava]